MQWYSVKRCLASGITFSYIIGGRGIGKTYSALSELKEQNLKFLYLRSTQAEIEYCMTPEGNPFKKLNKDKGWNVTIESGTIPTIINHENETPEEIGYAVALSTVGKLKSIDFSDIVVILWEEFILDKAQRRFLKDETEKFFNLYETVNRNRELNGEPPVRLLALSNAVSLASPILMNLGLIPTIEWMIRNDKQVFTDSERSIRIEIPKSDVSEAKKDTALYRLTRGTPFFEYSINNSFAYDSRYNVKRMNVREYVPTFRYEDVYFYSHKSNGSMYASYIHADCPYYDSDTYALFRRNHYLLVKEKATSGHLFYECFQIKTVVEALLKVN